MASLYRPKPSPQFTPLLALPSRRSQPPSQTLKTRGGTRPPGTTSGACFGWTHHPASWELQMLWVNGSPRHHRPQTCSASLSATTRIVKRRHRRRQRRRLCRVLRSTARVTPASPTVSRLTRSPDGVHFFIVFLAVARMRIEGRWDGMAARGELSVGTVRWRLANLGCICCYNFTWLWRTCLELFTSSCPGKKYEIPNGISPSHFNGETDK